MQIVFAPWRYKYVTSCDKDNSCVFCDMLASSEDEANFIVYRGLYNFVVLNKFPYVSGHVMVVPNVHISDLDASKDEQLCELTKLTKIASSCLKQIYHPHGINIGMNIGRAAGAGIDDHIHMHIMPRWSGDTNFVTVISDLRVIPEELEVSYKKIHGFFQEYKFK